MEDLEKKEIEKEAIKKYQESQTFSAIEFAKQLNQIMLEGMKDKNKTKFYKKYTSEQVDKYLADPAKYENELREVSRYLYVSSPQYYRLINYFPSMAILSPIVVPLDVEKLKKNTSKTEKAYRQSSKVLNNMKISHEFLKVLQVAFREDVFYGYEIETDESYYIKALNPKYCKICSVYDGCFTYLFDFSYFDTYKEDLESYKVIDKEFDKKYNAYKSNGNLRWQELNPDKEICIKIQETFDFCCPPFISIFNDLYDICDYKDMNKAKVERDNTNFVGFEMPVKKDSNNLDDWTLNIGTMKSYFAFIQSCLQGQLGAFMSPMPFKELNFTSKQSEIDYVSNSIKSFWGSAGVPDVLMGENKTAGTLKYSINTDESLLFGVYRQLERWLTRKIKKSSSGMFGVIIPDLTIFNLKDEGDKYLKLSQYGYQGARTLVEATMKVSQVGIEGLGYLENTILKKTENMIPVSSSYTQSSDSETGRPTQDEVTESGQQSRDDDVNKNRD